MNIKSKIQSLFGKKHNDEYDWVYWHQQYQMKREMENLFVENLLRNSWKSKIPKKKGYGKL